MSWSEDNFLKFMQVHSEHFGKDILFFNDVKNEFLFNLFTNKLFSFLDYTQVVSTPYVDVVHEGKGDIKSISVKKDFSLSPKQCVDIANFIAGRIYKHHGYSRLNDLDSFAIINYIKNGISLYTNYIYILNKFYSDKNI